MRGSVSARAAAIASLAIASLSASTARAQDRPPVLLVLHIDAPACPITDRQRLLRVVRAGLEGATVTDEPAGRSPGATRVTVSCGGTVARLRVDDPITQKSLERSISLSGVDGPVLSRIVGLAIVELVAASWIELELRAPPPAVDAAVDPGAGAGADEPAGAAASAARRRTERAAALVVARRRAVGRARAPRRIVVEASVGERQHDHALSLRAVELRASFRAAWLTIGVDARHELGERSLDTGRIDVDSLTGGARVAARLTVERLELEAGPGVRAGGARLTGTSLIDADELSFWAPVAALYGGAAARAWATERLAVGIGGEVGMVVAGVDARVASQKLRVLHGKFIGVTAGLAVAF